MGVTAYLCTSQLCKRYSDISSRTLARWQQSRKFPKPVITHKGATNMWSLEDVLAWEKTFKQADEEQ